MRLAGAPATVARVDSIHGTVALARFQLYDEAMPRLDDSTDLYRAEHHFRQVMSGQSGWSIVNPLISGSFYRQYLFTMISQDKAAAGDRDVPRVLTAAWDVARSAGPWWPLSRSAVLSDRPILMHLNEKSLLHRGGGPAAEYRDGVRVWAWNGHAMRESWIMNPETISARDLKEFAPTFREYAAARIGPSGKRAKLKPSSILKRELPSDAEERVALLRKHNNGGLPLFDRYLAGEYEKVWNELIALGPAVREDPHAADALAVAYETMRRVEANVRDITACLRALDYRATWTQAHEPPGPKAHKQVARLEKAAGALPLFRLASRELFNHFFHVSGATGQSSGAPPDAPAVDGGEAWDLEVRFSHVEAVLFEKLVCEPARLTRAPYGSLQSEILVELNSDVCPIMLNREVNSGYWDFPIREVTRDARLLFFRFFDWDVLAYRDNRYVLVQIDSWPSHPEAVGKQALIEAQYVHFVHAASRCEGTAD